MATSTTTTICFFNDCDNLTVPGSWKCDFHKNRSRCLVDACQNQVYARNLCVRHGGKRRCEAEGCGRNVRIGSFCSNHGAGSSKKLCTEDGCKNVAHKRHKCVRHGGGRQCKVNGCKTHARSGGYCCRHSRLVGQPLSTSMESIMKEESPLRPQAVSSYLSDVMAEWKLLPMLMDVTVLTNDVQSDDEEDPFNLVSNESNALDAIILDNVLADFDEDVLDKRFLDELFPSDDGELSAPLFFY
ncbi:Aste57867_268 [Aphanomyces stellatus]|uniref:Aste57867_268 protein n=1 Tax=Aphanomyces stellatus TaxID=120398 RepID=A0A485K7D1_9STRA|nr:hypothetical protein As57867_000268 [Aphanomyces stellatus]VFT77494.1 Aste57867_268 [Aphanomyces stellatus]